MPLDPNAGVAKLREKESNVPFQFCSFQKSFLNKFNQLVEFSEFGVVLHLFCFVV